MVALAPLASGPCAVFLWICECLGEIPWESNTLSSTITTKKTQKLPLESKENLSTFHKARLQHRLKHTRLQSLDEFDNYINKNPIPLDSCTTAIQ